MGLSSPQAPLGSPYLTRDRLVQLVKGLRSGGRKRERGRAPRETFMQEYDLPRGHPANMMGRGWVPRAPEMGCRDQRGSRGPHLLSASRLSLWVRPPQN